MKLSKILAPLLLASVAATATADDATNMSFDQGSVIIRCGTPPGQDAHISTKLFETAFPQWISTLQKHANEGRIARAHYLGELKQGIFIVVVGADRDVAMKNSELVLAELNEIMESSIKATGETPNFSAEESCLVGEIGPVAVLPQK